MAREFIEHLFKTMFVKPLFCVYVFDCNFIQNRYEGIIKVRQPTCLSLSR